MTTFRSYTTFDRVEKQVKTINDYWRKRGFDPEARPVPMMMKFVVVRIDKEGNTTETNEEACSWIIKSNMLNGVPQKRWKENTIGGQRCLK